MSRRYSTYSARFGWRLTDSDANHVGEAVVRFLRATAEAKRLALWRGPKAYDDDDGYGQWDMGHAISALVTALSREQVERTLIRVAADAPDEITAVARVAYVERAQRDVQALKSLSTVGIAELLEGWMQAAMFLIPMPDGIRGYPCPWGYSLWEWRYFDDLLTSTQGRGTSAWATADILQRCLPDDIAFYCGEFTRARRGGGDYWRETRGLLRGLWFTYPRAYEALFMSPDAAATARQREDELQAERKRKWREAEATPPDSPASTTSAEAE